MWKPHTDENGESRKKESGSLVIMEVNTPALACLHLPDREINFYFV